MAYYNGFPASYQPVYQPYQPLQQQKQEQGNLIWIQGEPAAKSYLVAPNTTVVLFDTESQTIYIKSADATGMPSMRILDYTIRDQKAHGGIFESQTVDFATKQEIDALRAELEEIKTRLKGVNHESAVQRDAE